MKSCQSHQSRSSGESSKQSRLICQISLLIYFVWVFLFGWLFFFPFLQDLVISIKTTQWPNGDCEQSRTLGGRAALHGCRGSQAWGVSWEGRSEPWGAHTASPRGQQAPSVRILLFPHSKTCFCFQVTQLGVPARSSTSPSPDVKKKDKALTISSTTAQCFYTLAAGYRIFQVFRKQFKNNNKSSLKGLI